MTSTPPSQEPKPKPKPIPLHAHPRPSPAQTPAPHNPLPTLLRTPSGLALLELQGTINLPPGAQTTAGVPIGRLHFEDYDPDNDNDNDNGAWMSRVWMYVGEHQRLQGEVKKLPRAVAVIRKRGEGDGDGDGDGVDDGGEGELEVVEIVKWKVVFSSRPEPVGSGDV